MPSITTTLKLTVPGARAEQTEAGLHAAAAHFRKLRVGPLEAADARFAREGAMMSDEVEYTEAQAQIANVWDDAEDAAFEACLGSGAPVPTGSCLEIVLDDPSDEIDPPLSPEADFAAAEETYRGEPIKSADIFYVGRSSEGDFAHFRWQPEEVVGWARMDDGEQFAFVDWAPTNMDHGQIAKLYG